MSMQKKLGVTDFVSEIKRVENYPDFKKLAHVINSGRCPVMGGVQLWEVSSYVRCLVM